MTDKKKSGIMGFLSNIGMVEETPDAAPAPPKTSQPPAAHATEHYSTPPTTAAPDPEMLTKLEARLQKNCPASYTAFMEMYESLKEDISDERQRFKVALKTSHTTTDQITSAVDTLVSTMDSAKAEFLHSFEENRSKRLGEAETSLKATDDLISSNEKQLQAIQETITSLRTKRDTDAQAKDHEAQRLDGIKSSFEAAHGQVVGRLQAQKSRIQTMPKV